MLGHLLRNEFIEFVIEGIIEVKRKRERPRIAFSEQKQVSSYKENKEAGYGLREMDVFFY